MAAFRKRIKELVLQERDADLDPYVIAMEFEDPTRPGGVRLLARERDALGNFRGHQEEASFMDLPEDAVPAKRTRGQRLIAAILGARVQDTPLLTALGLAPPATVGQVLRRAFAREGFGDE